jgi:hypothetical protein
MNSMSPEQIQASYQGLVGAHRRVLARLEAAVEENGCLRVERDQLRRELEGLLNKVGFEIDRVTDET